MRRNLLVAALLTAATPVNSQPAAPPPSAEPSFAYPQPKTVDVVEDHFGIKVADPYRGAESRRS